MKDNLYHPELTMETTKKITDIEYTPEKIQECISVLKDLVENIEHLAFLSKEQRIDLIMVAGRISRPNRDEIRKRRREYQRQKREKINNFERSARAATGIRSARETKVFTAPLQISDQGHFMKQDRKSVV